MDEIFAVYGAGVPYFLDHEEQSLTSKRKHRKQASRRGLTERELELTELLGEMLERLRWQEILAYANQYLIQGQLNVSREERDSVLSAATRAVDKDGKLHQWQERLARIKGEIQRSKLQLDQQMSADEQP